MKKKRNKKIILICIILIAIIIVELLALGLYPYKKYESSEGVFKWLFNGKKPVSGNVVSQTTEESQPAYSEGDLASISLYENNIENSGPDDLFTGNYNFENKLEKLSPVENIDKEIKLYEFLINIYPNNAGEFKDIIDILKLEKIQEQFKLDLINKTPYDTALQTAIDRLKEFINNADTGKNSRYKAREFLANFYINSAINKSNSEFYNRIISVKWVDAFEVYSLIKLKIEIKKYYDDQGNLTGIQKVITQYRLYTERPSSGQSPYLSDWTDICSLDPFNPKNPNTAYLKMVAGADMAIVSDYQRLLNYLCINKGDPSALAYYQNKNLITIANESGFVEDLDLYQSMMRDINSAISELEKIKLDIDSDIEKNLPVDYDFLSDIYFKEAAVYRFINNYPTAITLMSYLAWMPKGISYEKRSNAFMYLALMRSFDINEPHPLEKSLQDIDNALKWNPNNNEAKKIKRNLQAAILKIIASATSEKTKEELNNLFLNTEGWYQQCVRATAILASSPNDLLKEGQELAKESQNQYDALIFLILAINKGYNLEDFYEPGLASIYSSDIKGVKAKVYNVIAESYPDKKIPVNELPRVNRYTLLIYNLLLKNPDVALIAGGGTKEGAIKVMEKIKYLPKKYESTFKAGTVTRFTANAPPVTEPAWIVYYKGATIDEFINQCKNGNFIFTDPQNDLYKYQGVTTTWRDKISKQINFPNYITWFFIPGALFTKIPSRYAALTGETSGMITIAEWAAIKSPVIRAFANRMAVLRAYTLGKMESSVLAIMPKFITKFPRTVTFGTDLAFFWGSSYVINEVAGSDAQAPFYLFIMFAMPSAHVSPGAIHLGEVIQSSKSIESALATANIKPVSANVIFTNRLSKLPGTEYIIQIDTNSISQSQKMQLEGLLSKKFSREPIAITRPLKQGVDAELVQYKIDNTKMLDIIFTQGTNPAVEYTQFENLLTKPASLSQVSAMVPVSEKISLANPQEEFLILQQDSITKANLKNTIADTGISNNGLIIVSQTIGQLGYQIPQITTNPVSKCCDLRKIYEGSNVIESGLLNLEKGTYQVIVTADGDIKFYSSKNDFFKDNLNTQAYAYAEVTTKEVPGTSSIITNQPLTELTEISIPREPSSFESEFRIGAIYQALADRNYNGRSLDDILKESNKKITEYFYDYSRGDSLYLYNDGTVKVLSENKLEAFDPESSPRVYDDVITTKVVLGDSTSNLKVVDGFSDDSGLALVKDNGKYYVCSNEPGAQPELFDLNKHQGVLKNTITGKAKIYNEIENNFIDGNLFDNSLEYVDASDSVGSGILYERELTLSDGSKVVRQIIRQNGIDRIVDPSLDPTILYNSKTGETFFLNQESGMYESVTCYDPEKQIALLIKNNEAYVAYSGSKGEPVLFEEYHGEIYNPITGESYFIENGQVIQGRLKDSERGFIIWEDLNADGKTIENIWDPETKSSRAYNPNTDGVKFEDKNNYKLLSPLTTGVDIIPGLELHDPIVRDPLRTPSPNRAYVKTPTNTPLGKLKVNRDPVKLNAINLAIQNLKNLGWKQKGNTNELTKENIDGFTDTIRIEPLEDGSLKGPIPVSRIKIVGSKEELKTFVISQGDSYKLLPGEDAKIVVDGQTIGVRVRKTSPTAAESLFPEAIIIIGDGNIPLPAISRAMPGTNIVSNVIPYATIPKLTQIQLPLQPGDKYEKYEVDINAENIKPIKPSDGIRGTLNFPTDSLEGLDYINKEKIDIVYLKDNEGNTKIYDDIGRPIGIFEDPEKGLDALVAIKSDIFYDPEGLCNYVTLRYIPHGTQFELRNLNGNLIGIVASKGSDLSSVVLGDNKDTDTIFVETDDVFDLTYKFTVLKSQGYRITGRTISNNLETVYFEKERFMSNIPDVKKIQFTQTPGMDEIVNARKYVSKSKDFPWPSINPVEYFEKSLGGSWRIPYMDKDIAIARNAEGVMRAAVPSKEGGEPKILDGEVIGFDNYKKQMIVERDDGTGYYSNVDSFEKPYLTPRFFYFENQPASTIWWNALEEEIIIRDIITNELSHIKPFFVSDEQPGHQQLVFFNEGDDVYVYEKGSLRRPSYGKSPDRARRNYGGIFSGKKINPDGSQTDSLLVDVNKRPSPADLRTVTPMFISNFLNKKVYTFSFPEVPEDSRSGKIFVWIEGDSYPVSFKTSITTPGLPHKLVNLESKEILAFNTDKNEVNILNFKFYCPDKNIIIYQSTSTGKIVWKVFWPQRLIGERVALPKTETTASTTRNYDPEKDGTEFTDNENNVWRWNGNGFDNTGKALPKSRIENPLEKAKPPTGMITKEAALKFLNGVDPVKAANKKNIKIPIDEGQLFLGIFKTGGQNGEPVRFYAVKKWGKSSGLGEIRPELLTRKYIQYLNKYINLNVKCPEAFGYIDEDGFPVLVTEYITDARPFKSPTEEDLVQQLTKYYTSKKVLNELRADMVITENIAGSRDSNPGGNLIPLGENFIWKFDMEYSGEVVNDKEKFLLDLRSGAAPGFSTIPGLNNQDFVNALMKRCDEFFALHEGELDVYLEYSLYSSGYLGQEKLDKLTQLANNRKNLRANIIQRLNWLKEESLLDSNVVIPEAPSIVPSLNSIGDIQYSSQTNPREISPEGIYADISLAPETSFLNLELEELEKQAEIIRGAKIGLNTLIIYDVRRKFALIGLQNGEFVVYDTQGKTSTPLAETDFFGFFDVYSSEVAVKIPGTIDIEYSVPLVITSDKIVFLNPREFINPVSGNVVMENIPLVYNRNTGAIEIYNPQVHGKELTDAYAVNSKLVYDEKYGTLTLISAENPNVFLAVNNPTTILPENLPTDQKKLYDDSKAALDAVGVQAVTNPEIALRDLKSLFANPDLMAGIEVVGDYGRCFRDVLSNLNLPKPAQYKEVSEEVIMQIAKITNKDVRTRVLSKLGKENTAIYYLDPYSICVSKGVMTPKIPGDISIRTKDGLVSIGDYNLDNVPENLRDEVNKVLKGYYTGLVAQTLEELKSAFSSRFPNGIVYNNPEQMTEFTNWLNTQIKDSDKLNYLLSELPKSDDLASFVDYHNKASVIMTGDANDIVNPEFVNAYTLRKLYAIWYNEVYRKKFSPALMEIPVKTGTVQDILESFSYQGLKKSPDIDSSNQIVLRMPNPTGTGDAKRQTVIAVFDKTITGILQRAKGSRTEVFNHNTGKIIKTNTDKMNNWKNGQGTLFNSPENLMAQWIEKVISSDDPAHTSPIKAVTKNGEEKLISWPVIQSGTKVSKIDFEEATISP